MGGGSGGEVGDGSGGGGDGSGGGGDGSGGRWGMEWGLSRGSGTMT